MSWRQAGPADLCGKGSSQSEEPDGRLCASSERPRCWAGVGATGDFVCEAEDGSTCPAAEARKLATG